MSHVAHDREHSEACKDAGATVQGTESDAVSDGTEDIKLFIMRIIQKQTCKTRTKFLILLMHNQKHTRFSLKFSGGATNL